MRTLYAFHSATEVLGCWRGTVVERQSLAGVLFLSEARPSADALPLL